MESKPLSTDPPSGRGTLVCPCGKRLLIPPAAVGKKVRCPGCQRVLDVPAEDQNQALAPSLASHDPSQDTAAGHKPAADRELTDFLAPAQQPDEIGRLGGYRVLRVLGHGGMGVVFLAEDVGLRRKVALKTMLPRLATSGTARERFFREARAAAALKHDHIVVIHQVGEDRGAPFLAMEFLEGEALDERLKRDGRLPLAEVLRIGRELAEGLEHAHAQGMVHRDIKPANVWLEASPRRKPGEFRTKILDFGLARGLADDTHLTQSGAIVGTPAYMAPEQARGETVDQRCDLYSLGVVLYRLGTGAMPFQGKDTISLLHALALQTPAEPRTLNPELPPELNALIVQLLAKDPGKRPASAAEVAGRLRDLERDTSATQTLTRSVSEGTTPPRRVREGKPRPSLTLRVSVGLAAAAVLALVLGIVLFWPTPHGLVRLESDDPGVEIVFDKNGPTIKGADKEPISLRAGAHGLLVKRGDFTFETDKLVLKEGETITLKVELVGNKIQLSRDGQVLAARAAPPAKAFTNSLGMEFVLVPRGKSWLGGGEGTLGNQEVEVPYDFYLGKYEVTQEEWQKLTGLNPSFFKAVAGIKPEDQKRFPVEQVSWDDCQEFVKVLNAKVKEPGWVYRLPSEREWEYACRGGPLSDRFKSGFSFYFGEPTNTLTPDLANFDQTGLKRTCKVGSFKPNTLGLYDMHGNVWEWCDDEVKDDKGASRRLARGGCWLHHSGDCRAAYRITSAPSSRNSPLGLRLARVPVGTKGK
jgi:serine/threonine protein kinase/formylglycine-generating enzyme required for sulfatase activity